MHAKKTNNKQEGYRYGCSEERRSLCRSNLSHSRRARTWRRALGQAMVGNARAEHSAECGHEPPLLGLQHNPAPVFTHGRGWPTPRFVTFKQAQEAGGSVRKGEHGTKVYFVKQLRVKEGEGEARPSISSDDAGDTVFNVAQCERLPASIVDGKPARVRNPDARDAMVDDFLGSIGADIREGHGEAYDAPGQDFISFPAFAAFRGADHFYNVAFHELTHWTALRPA